MTTFSPRRQATRSRRRAILDAALACFLRKGFDAATIEHIRDASGASFGSIYHHFGSKQAIAAALYVEGLEDLGAALRLAMHSQPTVADGLQALVRSYFDWMMTHRDLGLFLLRVATADQGGQEAEEIDAVNRRYRRELVEWLQPFIERGEVVRLPDDVYASVIYGPSSHFARHWLAGREDVALPEAVTHLAETVCRALVQR
jgi:AcrR family transcriptional regulator